MVVRYLFILTLNINVAVLSIIRWLLKQGETQAEVCNFEMCLKIANLSYSMWLHASAFHLPKTPKATVFD